MAVLAGRVAVVTGASTGIGAGWPACWRPRALRWCWPPAVRPGAGAGGHGHPPRWRHRHPRRHRPDRRRARWPACWPGTRAEARPGRRAGQQRRLCGVEAAGGDQQWPNGTGPSRSTCGRPAWLCAAVLPGMQARGFGRIINIGSEAGVAIVPGLAAYCVSKHALARPDRDHPGRQPRQRHQGLGHLPWLRRHRHGLRRPRRRPGQLPDGRRGGRHHRFLLHTGNNVKLGPEILLRTMSNPMTS